MRIISLGLAKSNTLRYLTRNTPGYMFRRMRMNKLAERLKLAMEEGGFTQASLAEAAGVAQPSIWKIVSGRTKSSSRIVEIATVLGVRPEWLASGTEPMRVDGVLAGDKQVKNAPRGTIPDLFSISLWDANGETSSVMIIPDDIKTNSSRAYKLIHDSGYPEAPKGAMIVVDTAEQPGNNDFVYASVRGADGVYKFMPGSEQGFLVSSDPRMPLIPVTEEAKIIGVITYLSRSFKR